MKNIDVFEKNPKTESDFRPLVILEMANNHMGDAEHGLKIIRETRDAIKNFPEFQFAFKFQYRDLDTFIHPDYQNRLDLKYVKRFSETRLSEEEFLTLKREAEKLGFITVCTPFDEVSVERVINHDYDILKIASASFTDWPLLEKIIRYDKPVIASSGGSSLEDIDKVVSFFQHRSKKFALMHCVGEYPTPEENLQLNQIDLFRERYTGVPVGFSTHEAPDNFEAVKLALAKGAVILEKHVAVKTEKYEPNAYSATPPQIEKWLKEAALALKMAGRREIQRNYFTEKELADIRQFRRGVFAAQDIRKGERIDISNTFFAFPNQAGQILANDMSKYTIFTAKKDLKAKEAVNEADVEKIETREKVYEIVQKAKMLLNQAAIPVSNKLDFEISHHYGLDRFDEYGAVLITCINRQYCKKLILMFPGQKHPAHRHNVKEETFHILYGNFTFSLNGERQDCQAGDIITIEPGVNHGFYTETGGIFEEVSTTHQISDSFYEDETIMENKNRKTGLTYWIV